jgi:DNA gyrase/topoisomerase IV subunit A
VVNLQRPTEDILKANMTEYGQYITINRAIPDVRDGLKPVQRRILWSMHELGLKPERGSIKCARIVGDVIGLYHPHGDGSAYSTLVALATPWSIRYPLIQSVGSFGSILGDRAAAYRYTEAGVTDIGFNQFVDKKYLDYSSNFDGRAKEPDVLSAPLPMVLVNGYSGISVGFSGNIPAHEITEIAKIALNFHRKEPWKLSGPEKESGCFILSDDAEIQKVYTTGEGSIQFCSQYEVDDKGKKVTITGYAPYISATSITKSLGDLIDKDLVELSDFTGENIQLELTLKDTRLLETRIIPAISARESYQFHVIYNDRIELMNVEQILEKWREHRIMLWDRRIQDHLQQATQELLECDTQLRIIQNLKKFLDALQQPTIEEVKKALGKFLDANMIDFALELKVRQVLKLNETNLQDKHKTIEEKVARWKDTTPDLELDIQLAELVDYYESLKLPRNAKRTTRDKLPSFKKEMIKNHWFVVNEKSWEITADQPTRGKSFTGAGLVECSEWFGVVSVKGILETYSVYELPKKMAYERDQSKVLIAVHDRPSILVGLGEDNTIICRQASHGSRQFSKVSLQMVVQLEKDDILLIKFFNGKTIKMTYDELLPKCTQKVAAGWTPRLLGVRNAPVTGIHGCYKGQVFEKGKGTYVAKDTVKQAVWGVGKRNFVVNAAGGKSIVMDNNIPVDAELVIRL